MSHFMDTQEPSDCPDEPPIGTLAWHPAHAVPFLLGPGSQQAGPTPFPAVERALARSRPSSALQRPAVVKGPGRVPGEKSQPLWPVEFGSVPLLEVRRDQGPSFPVP